MAPAGQKSQGKGQRQPAADADPGNARRQHQECHRERTQLPPFITPAPQYQVSGYRTQKNGCVQAADRCQGRVIPLSKLAEQRPNCRPHHPKREETDARKDQNRVGSSFFHIVPVMRELTQKSKTGLGNLQNQGRIVAHYR
ncbi:hypothetical protein SDC9_203035 [bioreactor metagenome]|uniref:Uncharacterized protein n=1 Tax=bioreactor metagenome TaxID=1076179 RepID=A0A645J784_9ZZZZ